MNEQHHDKEKGLHPWRQLWSRRALLLLDLSVLTVAFIVAYMLRFDFAIPRSELLNLIAQLPLVVLLQFGAMLLAGVHMFIWRYIGLGEVKAFIQAAVWSVLPILVLRLALPVGLQPWRVPLSVAIVDTIFAFAGVLGIRVLRRVLYERFEKQRVSRSSATRKKPVLLIGAGRAGMVTAREIQNRGDMDIEVMGFVDDAPQKLGSIIHGVKVLGNTDELPRLVRELRIDHVVISLAQASRRDLRRILDVCDQIPVKVQVIPGIYEILQGRVHVTRIRDVQIEDVLGREPVSLDEDDIKAFITGKTVMVTGAGGSIGSELARQVARFQPGRLLLVERAEFALFNIERELREAWPDLSVSALVADIGDEWRMRAIFHSTPTHVVLHAAAHKHVPMMEFNSGEAVKNNILATHTLGSLAGEYGSEAFVLISTDKAVRPTSVMGATKRVAELVIQNLDRQFATRYLAVRFGNVIGSTGSVIPIFREQILKGGPVTVTHPDVVRYFMTIPEAAHLVLQAGTMGRGSEIFVLDMGDPVRIIDLAKDIIALSGFKPFEEIDIVFTGLRPGEKLFEELGTTEEHAVKTRHAKIFIGKIAAYPQDYVRHALDRLVTLTRTGSETDLREFLREFLPESQPSLAPAGNGHGAPAETMRELSEVAVGARLA